MEPNPYAPPQTPTLTAQPPELANAEALRREHIGTEATIKSVGALYYLGALYVILSIPIAHTMLQLREKGPIFGIELLLFALGLAFLSMGYGLRRLRGWARYPTIIFSGFGLLGFPIGTLINGYILVKVLGRQGRFVMTPEYQPIIAATPHVKYKTPLVVWIVLVVLILVLVSIWVSMGMSGR